MILNLRHTGIVVYDLEQSLKFYESNFGFKITKRMEETGHFICKILGLENLKVITVKMTINDNQMIELLDFTTHKKKLLKRFINDIGPTHIAFTVVDVDKLYYDFSSKGIKFISKPYTSPDGYAKVAFCLAPEGTYIELVELLKN